MWVPSIAPIIIGGHVAGNAALDRNSRPLSLADCSSGSRICLFTNEIPFLDKSGAKQESMTWFIALKALPSETWTACALKKLNSSPIIYKQTFI